MRKTKIGLSAACLTAVAMSATALAQTEIIYNNTQSENYLGVRTSPQNTELGDIANFAGTGRFLTELAFEYFASPTLSGNEFGQVNLYSVVDGVPTDMIFQSAPFSLASGFNARFENLFGTFSPTDSVAWTVTFAGFEGTEEGGLLHYNPPTVGSSPEFNGEDFYIRRNTEGGFDFVNTAVADNLSARFTAVPEPTTWALILGGLAGFGLLRRRKA